MRKSLVVFLLPVLFASNPIDSTEIDFAISNQENYQLNFKTTDSRFVEVPSNPNIFQTVDTYLDTDLTQKNGELKPNSSFTIDGVDVNAQNQVVFHIADKGYIIADPAILYDDIVLEQEESVEKVWLKKDFILYSSPIGNQQKKVKSNLKAYQPVTTSERVTTHSGTFVKIDGRGYVAAEAISYEDNRIEAVQELLSKKYSSSKFGIYVKQLSINKEAGVHQDDKMYAASIAKLPLLYYTQIKIDQEQVKLSTSLQYIDKTIGFKGSYDTQGSGSLAKQADNKKYTVEDLVNRVSKESDNAASNLLAYYLADQFKGEYEQEITAIAGEKWDMSSRQASPKMAGLVMEAIYHQSGYVLGSLQSTQFDQERIARDIPVTVAHKIGDAYDFRHDVALVYAEDPFVLSIFTENSDYATISQIANDVYGILK